VLFVHMVLVCLWVHALKPGREGIGFSSMIADPHQVYERSCFGVPLLPVLLQCVFVQQIWSCGVVEPRGSTVVLWSSLGYLLSLQSMYVCILDSSYLTSNGSIPFVLGRGSRGVLFLGGDGIIYA
jgi:hypothetical protein